MKMLISNCSKTFCRRGCEEIDGRCVKCRGLILNLNAEMNAENLRNEIFLSF